MTKRIGNKDEAQQRGKAEKKDIKRTNIAREAIKKSIPANIWEQNTAFVDKMIAKVKSNSNINNRQSNHYLS